LVISTSKKFPQFLQSPASVTDSVFDFHAQFRQCFPVFRK